MWPKNGKIYEIWPKYGQMVFKEATYSVRRSFEATVVSGLGFGSGRCSSNETLSNCLYSLATLLWLFICICLAFGRYFSKYWNIFVQILKCICQNIEVYLLIGPLSRWSYKTLSNCIQLTCHPFVISFLLWYVFVSILKNIFRFAHLSSLSNQTASNCLEILL